jgi:hypothetical protein
VYMRGYNTSRTQANRKRRFVTALFEGHGRSKLDL